MGRMKCFIAGCSSTASDSDNNAISFHKLNISNRDLYREWITVITVVNNQSNASKHPKSAVICSKHFKNECFIPGASFMGRKLKGNVIPSIFPSSHDMQNVEYIVEDEMSDQGITVNDNEVQIETDDAIPSTSVMTSINTNATQQSVCVTRTPTRKIKYLRHARDIGDIENASPRSLRNFIKFLKSDNLAKSKKIYKLQKTCSRRKKQVQNLKNLYLELKKKKYIYISY